MRIFFSLMFGLMCFSVNTNAQFSNDLRMEKVFTGDVTTDYVYTKIPVTQAVEIVAGAVVSNVGLANQNNIEYHWDLQLNGSSVASGTVSGSALLAPEEVDTVWINTGYTPVDIGMLEVLISVSSDEIDETPADNSFSEELEITWYIWGHDYEGEDYDEIGYVAANPDGELGFELGSNYFCHVDGEEITAAQFAIGAGTTASTVALKVYEDLTSNPPVSETFYDIQPGDLSTGAANFITCVLDDPVPMTSGSIYIVTLEIFSGDDGFIMGQYIDDGDGGQSLYLGADNTWYNWTGLTTSMRLDLEPYDGWWWPNVAENEHVSGVYLYPNPATENLLVGFVSKDGNSLNLSMMSADGSLVFEKIAAPKAGVNTTVSFSTDGLASGVYLVQIQGEKSSLTHRVVVQ
jgi:hypothetical protein